MATPTSGFSPLSLSICYWQQTTHISQPPLLLGHRPCWVIGHPKLSRLGKRIGGQYLGRVTVKDSVLGTDDSWHHLWRLVGWRGSLILILNFRTAPFLQHFGGSIADASSLTQLLLTEMGQSGKQWGHERMTEFSFLFPLGEAGKEWNLFASILHSFHLSYKYSPSSQHWINHSIFQQKAPLCLEDDELQHSFSVGKKLFAGEQTGFKELRVKFRNYCLEKTVIWQIIQTYLLSPIASYSPYSKPSVQKKGRQRSGFLKSLQTQTGVRAVI